MEFLNEFKIVGVTIGFVIALATHELIDSVVNDMINPLIGLAIQDEYSHMHEYSYSILGSNFQYGELIIEIIRFTIIIALVFIAYKTVVKLKLHSTKD